MKLTQCLLKHANRKQVVWVESPVRKNSVIILKKDDREWVVLETYSTVEQSSLHSEWEVGGLGKRPKK